MTSPAPPTNFDLLQRNLDSAKKMLQQSILMGFGLMILGSFIADRPTRLAIAVAGLGLNYAARPSVELLKRNRRSLNDLEDIHVSAFGKVLYEVLTSPKQQETLPAAPPPPALQDNPPTILGEPQQRDLARDIAHFDPHVAIVSESRSGKTTVLIAAIHEALAMGHTVFLFDGKGDRRLEQIRSIHYYKCNTPERVANCLEVIRALALDLGLRQDTHTGEPVSVFVDEWNLIRLRASQHDAETAKSWSDSLIEILLQGAAEQYFLRITAHTSRIQDWGKEWNTGILDSLKFVALGRNGQYDSIEDLIRYQVASPREAKQYQDLLDQYREMDLNLPLALTTIPKRGFYTVPLYPVQHQFNAGSAPVQGRSPGGSPNSLNSPQASVFNGFSSEFSEFAAPSTAQFGPVDDLELALSICEAVSDPALPQSTTAFVEWFWGIKRGGNKAFKDAVDRVNRIMEQEGLSWDA